MPHHGRLLAAEHSRRRAAGADYFVPSGLYSIPSWPMKNE